MKQDDEPNLFDDETIGSIASQHQLTPAQVMLAWAVNRGHDSDPQVGKLRTAAAEFGSRRRDPDARADAANQRPGPSSSICRRNVLGNRGRPLQRVQFVG